MMVESLIQGLVIGVNGGTYSLQTRGEKVRNVQALSTTVNNGFPKVGDHALVMVNDANQALVITRFFYSGEQAA